MSTALSILIIGNLTAGIWGGSELGTPPSHGMDADAVSRAYLAVRLANSPRHSTLCLVLLLPLGARFSP